MTVSKKVQKQVQFHMKMNGLMNQCMNYTNNQVPLSENLTAYDNAIVYKTKNQEIVFFPSVNELLNTESVPQHIKDRVLFDVTNNATQLNRSEESIKLEPVILGGCQKTGCQGVLLQCETMIQVGEDQFVYGANMQKVSH